MFTQTFTSTNADTDPAIGVTTEYAASDTTDVSAFGFANCIEICDAFRSMQTTAPGFVETVISESTPHRVVRHSVWNSEAERDAFMTAFRADTNLYTAYTEFAARYRAHYNITVDPAPNQPPHYFP
jgi:heme-degrading monooxygenase HmoA